MVTKSQLKSKLSLITVGLFILGAVIGLLCVFIPSIWNDVVKKILFTTLILFAASIFEFNMVDPLYKKKPLAFVTTAMIAISAILFLVYDWRGTLPDGFMKFIIIFAMLTVFIDILYGFLLSLGKRFLGVQISFYVLFGYVEFAIFNAILKLLNLFDGFGLTAFIAICIIGVTLYVILKVKAKNVKIEDEENFSFTKDEEIETLKKEIERLQNLLKDNHIEY